MSLGYVPPYLGRANANSFIRTDGSAILTDFSLTSRLEREDANILDSQGTRRSLAYIPPEGTGRVNRGVDYRADFYSLGVVFYELFVGYLPFRSTDPLDMIHQHITKTAKSPHEVNPAIPEAISKVIMKLMSKNAEDRYQSAEALQADLLFIQERYLNNTGLDGFILGHTDNTSRFLIPEKLYGRETELAQLFDAFENVKIHGGAALVTISGETGVGKSRLVHELQRPVVEARGRFASGTFDEYRHEIPFCAMIQVLQDLVGQLVSESETTVDKYRKKILSTIGADISVLLEVIPEIAMLLGSELPSAETNVSMGSMEREGRFKALIAKFLMMFGPRGRPLVLFLVL
jgi:osomolarity two-component system, sensor histidine kinase CHK1